MVKLDKRDRRCLRRMAEGEINIHTWPEHRRLKLLPLIHPEIRAAHRSLVMAREAFLRAVAEYKHLLPAEIWTVESETPESGIQDAVDDFKDAVDLDKEQR